MKQSIDWNQTYLRGKDYVVLTTQQLSELIHMLPRNLGKKHLDIGCGTGQLNRDMFHRGFATTGVDVSDVAIRIAKDSIDISNEAIGFEVGDVFGFKGKQFDLITCKYVYTFVDDKDSFLKKVTELMNEGGLFVIITPNITMLDKDKRSIALSVEDMMAKISQYFNVEIAAKNRDVYYLCSPL